MTESVAVVGSREWPDSDAVTDYVNSLEPGTTVVSGGARGVDQWAEIAALDRGLPTLIFKPDWDQHGNAAGFIRNMDIVDHADRVVAFWCNGSKGTKSSIDYAREQGKPVLVFKPPSES